MAQVKKRKVKRNVEQGRIYIKATFNNTIMTITDAQGNAIGWSSTGVHGFKGSRKSTPFAAQTAGEQIGQYCRNKQIRQVDIILRGAGNGREAAMRGLIVRGVRVRLIRDTTCVPHNGCRAPQDRQC